MALLQAQFGAGDRNGTRNGANGADCQLPAIPHARLGVQRCRSLLNPTCRLTDDEILRLRDSLYDLANVLVEGCENGKTPSDSLDLSGIERKTSCELSSIAESAPKTKFKT